MIEFQALNNRHRIAVMDILNYYILKDTSVFSTIPLKDDFFDVLLVRAKKYPSYAVCIDNKVVGYCALSQFNSFNSFDKTCTLSIFIDSGFTTQGIGSMCLDRLICSARANGIKHLVSEVSSLNRVSLSFHLKHGFKVVGHLENIGEKFNTPFGVVYLQLDI